MNKILQLARLIAVIFAIFAASLTFFGLGCKHGAEVGGPAELTELAPEEGGVEEYEAAPKIIKVTPADRSSISNTKQIVIEFSKSMDMATLALNGAMGQESDGGTWSTSKNENDTLTVSPQTKWTLGAKNLIIASCKDLSGNPLPETKLDYAIHVVFVKAGASGDGTMDSPLGNINDAITNALSMFPIPSQVHVAQGIYEVESGSTHIDMEEGVSLYGGFSPDDWTIRDPSVYPTVIEDKILTGGSDVLNPNCAVKFEAPMTDVTVIDGFKIIGGGGDHAMAICVRTGASPTISNNILRGDNAKRNSGILNMGSATIFSNDIKGGGLTFAIGMYNVYGGVSKIYDNLIVGGDGAQMSIAILNAGAAPIIYGNDIKGGSGVVGALGIYNAEGASAMIYNNTIDGGIGPETGGITNVKGSSKIFNNTIDGGAASTKSAGIAISTDSKPTINNNIIFTSSGMQRYGIYESASTGDPLEVKNNDVFDCPTALYYDDDLSKNYKVICPGPLGNFGDMGCVTQLSTPSGMNNISKDPKFEGPDDWHLSTSSPIEVTGGGLDLSADFQTDKDGKPRTVPWSIGAYEYD